MSEQLQSSIATVVTIIIANWAVIFPLLRSSIKTLWDKSIAFRDMQNDITNLKADIEKLKKDVTAAHDKIRKRG